MGDRLIRQHQLAEYKLLEEMSLNGWPALRTIVYDGWLLRFANGYTKRSNSVSPIYGPTLDLSAKINVCEDLYTKQGLRPVFKITPFTQPGTLDAELAARGYEQLDQSLVQTLELADLPATTCSDIKLSNKLTEEWLEAFAGFSGITSVQCQITRQMLEDCPLQRAYGLWYAEGIPVACGMAVIENGWVSLYDVITAPNWRGKGYGRMLVLGLLNWGKKAGATSAFLLVVKSNEPAIRLYERIGFRTAYDYWYRAGQVSTSM